VRSGTAAAIVAATMTRWLLDRRPHDPGVWLCGDPRMPTVDLLEQVSRAGLTLFEFSGDTRPPDA